jgi:hypothetical protein
MTEPTAPSVSPPPVTGAGPASTDTSSRRKSAGSCCAVKARTDLADAALMVALYCVYPKALASVSDRTVWPPNVARKVLCGQPSLARKKLTV